MKKIFTFSPKIAEFSAVTAIMGFKALPVGYFMHYTDSERTGQLAGEDSDASENFDVLIFAGHI